MLTGACTCSSWTSRERSLIDPASSANAILNGRGIARVVVVDDDVGQPLWYGLVDLLDLEDKAAIGQETEFDLLNSDWRERLDLASPKIQRSVAAKVNSVATVRRIRGPEERLEIQRLSPWAKFSSLTSLNNLLPANG